MRQHGLGALSAVAAVQAIDGESRPQGETVKVRAFDWLIEMNQLKVTFDRFHFYRKFCERFLLKLGWLLDVIVDPIDGDLAFIVLHAGKQMHERPQRVGSHAAPIA